ncbi:phenylacetate--CoA ligase family protein [Roseovarius sp. TE539]|uniref:phenylacetate--CoA ligase family protein n=1 Tax=Roseovarius sp. TE539 TaxID=2249812 RepID=UPI00215B8CF7|nr:phenylacetate--CoA ligase family protein [Roseovarius sp. TE539]
MTDRLSTLARIVTEATQNAPALAARLSDSGIAPADLAEPGTLERLPVLAKTELMELQSGNSPFGGHLSVPLQEVAHLYASPGPIFEPVLRGHEAHGFDRMFRAGGLGPGDVALNTWSYHLVPAGLLFDAGARATGATVVPSGPGRTELQVNLIETLGVTAFLGSTAYFEKVANAFASTHGATKDRWPVRRAFLGGEPGDWMAKRRRLEREHGVTTHSAYGTADLGLVGFEADGQPGYLCHEERLVQICDPDTGVPLSEGMPGQVVVTTLARGWPMIRFGTGDMARALEIGADGFVTRMSGIEGRVGDGVKVREIFVYATHARALSRSLGGGSEARIRISREGGSDHITLELSGPARPEEEILDAFQRITRLRADTVIRCDRHTISEPLEDNREF